MEGYFEKQFRDYLSALQEKANKVSDEVTEMVGKNADAYAKKIMIPVAREEVIGRYHDAAKAWYDAYKPKKYKRIYSLLSALKLSGSDDGFIWYTEEEMMKPSWIKGYPAYNIYDYIFMEGSHGGPVHGRMPVYTTSIPEIFGLFDESSDQYQELHDILQEMFDETGHEYFDEHFPEEFQKYFTL